MPDVVFRSNGSTAPGYLALPEERGPGVVVLQEWWGLDSHVRDLCDRFAVDGFVALAPDLYRGRTTEELDEAQRLMLELDARRAVDDVRGAVEYLAGNDAFDDSGIASVGYCLGGIIALRAASREPDLSAAVSHYAQLPYVDNDVENVRAPILGHFGTADEFVPIDDVLSYERRLRAAGVDVRFELYKGRGHAFCNTMDQLGNYDADAARLAWKRTTRFLRQRLRR